MNHQKIFQRYIQISDLLGQMFPNILEVVVHDFHDIDHAIIYIVNGHISGRLVGDPTSELNIRRLVEEGQFPDFLVNFTSRNPRGQQLKSSSLAIRDDQGKLIGAMCLHFDVSQFEQFQRFLQFFINTKVDATLGLNDFGAGLTLDEEINKEIEAWQLQKGIFTSQLTYKDKQAIVEHLFHKGFFNKKAAITLIANSLQLTRQSVYNYLDMARKNTD